MAPYIGANAGGGQQTLRLRVKLTSGPTVEAGIAFGRRLTLLTAPEHTIELRRSVRW